MSEWIKCSERMPKNKPGCWEYLVYDNMNNKVGHDYWNVRYEGDRWFEPFWNHYGEHVTHWQPLPMPPQD